MGLHGVTRARGAPLNRAARDGEIRRRLAVRAVARARSAAWMRGEPWTVYCYVPESGGGVAVPGSAADRIVGAIRPGVRRGDAVYAAMT